MLRLSVLFIYFCVLSASAAQLSVIAIDYPPFTSKSEPRDGIAFALLSDSLKGSDLLPVPAYWSPARAHKLVQKGDWCASFYPPLKPDDNSIIIGLGEEPIRLGLFRHRQQSAFKWDTLTELEGKKVAYLRALSRDGIGKDMTDAGMEIFNVETVKQGLMLLDRGRVDYAFGDSISGPLIMKSLNISPETYQFSSSIFRELPVGIWLNLKCEQASMAAAYLESGGYQRLAIN
ncbi:hypothetical protein FM038_016535 [Shewanella eurypsychrophilus]|uniref:Solute-binding protein family 3/N-terminal domain-containing protein n=1 Tax=Shewanella eurypsychrophilus TaxID=2593656 RepID=A0ABX6VAI8_9GAMM|nr:MULTISPECIES: hypothetical protein [Shewanella]QFU23622.1 hypothetical protein FS418_18335 [Shewanella sp. YLB-09]QPG58845.1 hypothetical protein FM038_016535 [Shewanella eurypsychrophilus]